MKSNLVVLVLLLTCGIYSPRASAVQFYVGEGLERCIR